MPPVIEPAYYKYLLEVTLEFPGPQTTAPSATQLATDAQAAIAADTTNINAQSVYVKPFVPAGSGE
jgi:hypothetical protein